MSVIQPSAIFTVNATAFTAPEYVRAVTQNTTVELALASTLGVTSVTWRVVGASDVDVTHPTITRSGYPLGVTASFTMPNSAGIALLIEAKVNNGRDVFGATQASYVFRAIVGVETPSGFIPLVHGEQGERGAVGYVGDLNRRIIEAPEADLADYGLPRGFATMAALRTYLAGTIANTKATTNSFSTPGDGGGGTWRIVTGAAPTTYVHNGGTVIVPSGGDGSIAALREFTGAVRGEWFGASPNASAATNTAAIQAALDTGYSVVLGYGSFAINGTIYIKFDGQSLTGLGKMGQTVLVNTTTSALLVSFGVSATSYARRAGLGEIEIRGGVTSLGGVALLGIVDDGLSGDASKSCWMSNVRIRDIGAGSGLRVASWANTFSGVEIWDCATGLVCGSEFNANAFSGLYINGCTNEGIICAAGAGIPAASQFFGTTVQYCGGTEASIDIKESYALTFFGLYLEGSTAPTDMLFDAGAHACGAYGVMHNLATGTANRPVITTRGKNIEIHGVSNLGGTVDELVLIEGTLPLTHVSGLHVSAGTATNGVLVDNSTRKATFHADPLEGRAGPINVKALTSEIAQSWRNSVDDAIQMFVQNGRLYLGADTTVPNLRRSGGTMEVYSADAIGNLRAGIFLIGGSGSVRLRSGTGTPEGTITSDVGSLYLRTDGGASTTLYVKETGVGNTGWVAK